MTTTIKEAVQPHNERAAGVWSAGGRHYDRISFGIADAIAHCVLRLDPKPGEQVLDVATGTGWASRLVARRGAAVAGVDIAAGLLDAARAEAAAQGLPIDYQLGDAESLSYEDASFDAVISTFGVMFATRPEAAARELARVVRPGGRLALAVWSLDSNVFQMFQVMKRYMPAPPTPAPPSPFAWGQPARIRELLGEAFDLRLEKGISYYREPSPEAAWDTFSTGYGPTRVLAESLDASRRRSLREDLVAFHAGFQTELGITVPREYWVVDGRRR
jgi:SAM-dependent methyltransferase